VIAAAPTRPAAEWSVARREDGCAASEDGVPCAGPGEVEVAIGLPAKAPLQVDLEDPDWLRHLARQTPTVLLPALLCLRHARPLLEGDQAGAVPCLRLAGYRLR
jgi:hypothetical protein